MEVGHTQFESSEGSCGNAILATLVVHSKSRLPYALTLGALLPEAGPYPWSPFKRDRPVIDPWSPFTRGRPVLDLVLAVSGKRQKVARATSPPLSLYGLQIWFFLYRGASLIRDRPRFRTAIQEYLAHNKTPTPLRPLRDPRPREISWEW